MDTPTMSPESCPYDYKNPVNKQEQLLGRQTELEVIRQLLRCSQGGLCLVIGGAYSGKTSFLLTLDSLLKQRLAEQRGSLAVPYYTRPKGLQSLEVFCEGLIVGLRQSARDLLDVCGIDDRELVYLPQLYHNSIEYLERNFPRIHEACTKKIPKGCALKIALLVDDADRLLEQSWRADFLSTIHEIFDVDKPLHFYLILVLAGAQPLYEATSQEVVRKLCPRPILLNNLPQETVREMMEKPLGTTRHFPDESVASMHSQTGGHPYLTKCLLASMHSNGLLTTSLSPDMVRESAQNLVRQDESLRQIFNAWSTSCGQDGRWLYSLFLKAKGRLSRQEVLQQTAGLIQPTSIDPVMNTLCCHGLVAKSVGDDEDWYEVNGEMFAAWFRRNILPTVQPPLPVAGSHVAIFTNTVTGPVHAGSGDISYGRSPQA